MILDPQSEDDLARWEAFGRFLDDFATFGEAELPEFFVWREYMVYAVAMGCVQNLAEALTLKVPESYSTAEPSVDKELYRRLRELELYDTMYSIGREVTEGRLPSTGSSDSDSSGGGGFSDFDGGSDSGSDGDFID